MWPEKYRVKVKHDRYNILKISYFEEGKHNEGIKGIAQTMAFDDSFVMLEYQEVIIFRSRDIGNMVKSLEVIK